MPDPTNTPGTGPDMSAPRHRHATWVAGRGSGPVPTDDADASEGHETVFRDVVMLVLFGFVTIVVLLLPHLNPPTRADETLTPPGSLIVEVVWPSEANVDVDLWVRAPGDRPVGYSNKSGAVFDLLRDDLGRSNDLTDLNYEVAYTRGAPGGEYVVNLHLYRGTGGLPVTCIVVVSLRNGEGETDTLTRRTVTLDRVGQELTVARLALDDAGRFVTGSLHDTPVALRTRPNG